MKIITNNHWRKPVYGFELPEKIRAEFSYLKDLDDLIFIKYKGEYLLDEFMRIDNTMLLHTQEFKDWQGYMSDSFFSGLLIRYSEDMEEYQIATYIN